MASFRLRPETALELEAFGLQAVAVQPRWLRPPGRNGVPRASRRDDDPWEVALFPAGKGGLSKPSVAWGFGHNPDSAVARALSDPRARARISRLTSVMNDLGREMSFLQFTLANRTQRVLGWGYADFADDEIPF